MSSSYKVVGGGSKAALARKIKMMALRRADRRFNEVRLCSTTWVELDLLWFIAFGLRPETRVVDLRVRTKRALYSRLSEEYRRRGCRLDSVDEGLENLLPLAQSLGWCVQAKAHGKASGSQAVAKVLPEKQ